MKTLALSTGWPWPEDSGGRQRLAALLRTLGHHGSLEFVHLDTVGQAHPSEELRELAAQISTVEVHLVERGRAAKMLRWLAGHDPLLVASYPLQPSIELIGSRAAHCEWVWAHGPLAAHIARIAAPSKTIVDFADLPHEVQFQQVRISPTGRRESSIENVVARVAHADIDRWRQFEARTARECRAVTVCSEREQREFSAGRVEVLPNGYRNVDPVGRLRVGAKPRILFAASPIWPPNVEGARLLVDVIRPGLLRRLPEAEILLTGHYDFLAERGDILGVRMLGHVQKIESALARADLIVVPLRSGSGTRLKVLEGWAHRIPVVSTSKGVEGLEGRDSEHFLCADDPEDFIEACVRALTDLELRRYLIESGHRLYRERYTWDRIGAHLGRIIEGLR